MKFFPGGGIGRKIGTAVMGIWAVNSAKDFKPGMTIWVFNKTVKAFNSKKVILKLYDGTGSFVKQAVDIEMLEEIPEQFNSTIGTKSGITVQDDAEEFCKRQRECDMKPDIRLVHIESSSLCNLRCQYCIVSNNYHCIERCVIKQEVLDAAIRSIQELPSVNTIQVSGLGEPLTNPDFVKMLWRIYRETHVRNVWFFSNGMLLTKEFSDEIAKIPLKFKIFFSIDGRTPEENGIQRRGSIYSVVKENIYYFLKQIEGKKNFRVKIHNLIIAKENEVIYTPEFLLNDFGFLGIDTHRAFYFPELSEELLNEQGVEIHKVQRKQICKRMFSQATIRSNGDVIRCHWDSACDIVMGNVLHNSLKEIWHGEKYVELRKTMMSDVPFEELPKVCQKCHAMNEGYLYRK